MSDLHPLSKKLVIWPGCDPTLAVHLYGEYAANRAYIIEGTKRLAIFVMAGCAYCIYQTPTSIVVRKEKWTTEDEHET